MIATMALFRGILGGEAELLAVFDPRYLVRSSFVERHYTSAKTLKTLTYALIPAGIVRIRYLLT